MRYPGRVPTILVTDGVIDVGNDGVDIEAGNGWPIEPDHVEPIHAMNLNDSTDTDQPSRCRLLFVFCFCLAVLSPVLVTAQEIGEHGYVSSGDVKIHYVTAGQGPLVVMMHGFPDYWYTWRKQIPAIAKSHQVVAIDLRGYNKSNQPEGIEQYALPKLVGDVEAVIRHFGRDRAVIVGHDWGGMIAWSFAMQRPQMTQRLVVLNLPHPAGLTRELADNPAQQKASAYARHFQQPDAASGLTAEGLTFWVKDPEARTKYVEAFKRSSFEAMLNYYKANYPREPYRRQADFPKVQCPTLLIHGLKDTALLASGLDGVWDQIDQPLTLVTVPDADHFVQQDAADLVTKTIVHWLQATDEPQPKGESDSRPAPLSLSTRDELRQELAEEVTAGRIVGAMHLVQKDARGVFFQANGVQDVQSKRSIGRDTIVRIYSMTKPITSVAAMTLWELGKFDLDDPVSDYIPAFRDAKVMQKDGDEYRLVPPKRPMTVRDCLRHTTGYSYGYGEHADLFQYYKKEELLYGDPMAMFPPSMTIREAADRMARVPASHHPGERFTYGFSTDLVGRLIEVWSGQSLDRYLESAVLEPLGMNDTAFFVPPPKRDRFASCHTGDGDETRAVDKSTDSPFLQGFAFLSGGGGLVSTIDDYAKFCQMMIDGGRAGGVRLLKPETVELMFTNQLAETPGDFEFGLGFAISDQTIGKGSDARVAKKYSWGGYASTDFCLVPDERLFQIFVRQRVPSNHRFAREAFRKVHEGLASRPEK